MKLMIYATVRTGELMTNPFERFSLSVFEALDIDREDAVRANDLIHQLERHLLRLMNDRPAWEGIDELVEALNQNGHRFEWRTTDVGWKSFFETTNEGTRDFWIHANREDEAELICVNILYFEKLQVSAAKRKAAMSELDRSRQELIDRFYERGLELAAVDEHDPSLNAEDRLLLSLYLLESGVNNGGFSTYIVNTEGRQLESCQEDLTEIGATQLAALVQDVLKLFPTRFEKGLTNELWETMERERDALDKLDVRFCESKENLAELVVTHLEMR